MQTQINMRLNKTSIYVGFFLAVRDIKQSNIWTTALIIFIMTLTFVNMNLVGGLLIGLAQGVIGSYKVHYSSNIIITPQANKNNIRNTSKVIAVIESLPTKKEMSVRYVAPAIIEHGYQAKIRSTDLTESAATELVGIDPVKEDRVTSLAKTIVAGSYLSKSDVDEVLVGSSLIKKYSSLRGSAVNIGAKILKNADVGSKIKINLGGVQKEVFIKGIVSTDGTNIDNRVFMVDTQAREILKNKTLEASEISIKLIDNASEKEAKKYIVNNLDNNDEVLVQTSDEALPGGVNDIFKTFGIMGNVIGGIALTVGAVTIFIVIFVNAVTRRKYIGILKGIGIASSSIEFSYIFQALFYAMSGVFIASLFTLGLITPYFSIYPISYPLAKGSIAITASDVLIRGIILSVTALVSGFVPAWVVTKQNTLDSILGR